jgi:hypothetical protein
MDRWIDFFFSLSCCSLLLWPVIVARILGIDLLVVNGVKSRLLEKPLYQDTNLLVMLKKGKSGSVQRCYDGYICLPVGMMVEGEKKGGG